MDLFPAGPPDRPSTTPWLGGVFPLELVVARSEPGVVVRDAAAFPWPDALVRVGAEWPDGAGPPTWSTA